MRAGRRRPVGDVSGRSGSRRSPKSDYPAVGDWVVLDGRRRRPGGDPAVLPRRSAFVRSAADASPADGRPPRRRAGASPRTSTSRSSSPASTTTSTCAASSATSRSPGRAASRPIVVLNKADRRHDLERRLRRGRGGRARRCRSSCSRRSTGDHLDRPRAVSRARADRGRAGLVGRRQVDARQRAARRGRARPRPRSAIGRFARAPHDDPSRAVRAARRGAAHRHARASARSRWPVPTRASRPRSTTSPSSPLRCRFSDCRHDGEPGCAVRVGARRRELPADRFASHRKLERELAHAERKVDYRARAAESKRWKSIHKAVERQMQAKYREAR